MATRDERTTYFGLWSAEKVRQASNLLVASGVRYELREEKVDQNVLEEWRAWDPRAKNPNIGFHLWILTADLPKVGAKLVEAFPERKFDAP